MNVSIVSITVSSETRNRLVHRGMEMLLYPHQRPLYPAVLFYPSLSCSKLSSIINHLQLWHQHTSKFPVNYPPRSETSSLVDNVLLSWSSFVYDALSMLETCGLNVTNRSWYLRVIIERYKHDECLWSKRRRLKGPIDDSSNRLPRRYRERNVFDNSSVTTSIYAFHI